MDIRLFLSVFGTVLLAELGDKTQLATLVFAARPEASKWTVFAGSSLALVTAAGLAVLAGGALSRTLGPRLLNTLAGIAFVLIGLWVLASGHAGK
jgi:putative Ca2+/H+ antiporter (TMEM165/GDT1 family)